MKKYLVLFFISLSFISYSQTSVINPVVPPAEIVKDLMSWLYYQRDHLIWSADYVTLDTGQSKISRQRFLESLTTGHYLPLQVTMNNGSLCYQLYVITNSIDKDIVSTIKAMAARELQYLKMEGQPLPAFDFRDLNGNLYNKKSTIGKILVINCWFVSCTSCIAEMPDLNEMVKQYKRDKNILFIALAPDPEADIRRFLNSHSFNYKIVPDQSDYLSNKLHIIGYPTQLVINPQGLVVKVIESNTINELRDVINKEINKITSAEVIQ